MVSGYRKFLQEKLNKGKWYQRFISKIIHKIRPSYFKNQYLKDMMNKTIDKVMLDRIDFKIGKHPDYQQYGTVVECLALMDRHSQDDMTMMTTEQDIDKYSKLSYDEKHAFRDAYAKELMESTPIEELAKTWFKDYGTMSGWGAATSFNYGVAYAIHVEHMKKYPEMHKKMPQKNNWRFCHEDNCSCGLRIRVIDFS